jgi:(2Fe-2S) ferredoxin
MTVRVLVCRDCCCGTTRKHPDTDHDAQLAAVSEVAKVRVTRCLGECSQSNVIVARTQRSTWAWFGHLVTPSATKALCDWLAAGAPLPVPDTLAVHQFARRSIERDAQPVPVRLAI